MQVIHLLDGCTSSDKMTSIGSILIIENIEIVFSLVTLRINPREEWGSVQDCYKSKLGFCHRFPKGLKQL